MNEKCEHGYAIINRTVPCCAQIASGAFAFDRAVVERAGYERAGRDIAAWLRQLACNPFDPLYDAADGIERGDYRPEPTEAKRE